MSLTERDIAFLDDHHAAAMITVNRDGVARAARVGIALVDGQLWSSGTRDRVRTKRLRRDPRCTLFVFDPGYAWLAFDTVVTLLEGPDAPSQNLRLFRQMQGKPEGSLRWFDREMDEAEFLQAMRDEGRLIYQFEVQRSYGLL
jgi:Pyridoxamine 5'-phosphate oxidase